MATAQLLALESITADTLLLAQRDPAALSSLTVTRNGERQWVCGECGVVPRAPVKVGKGMYLCSVCLHSAIVNTLESQQQPLLVSDNPQSYTLCWHDQAIKCILRLMPPIAPCPVSHLEEDACKYAALRTMEFLQGLPAEDPLVAHSLALLQLVLVRRPSVI